MLELFRTPSLGELTAVFSKKPNSDSELAWYLHLDLAPIKTRKETCDYSVLIEDVPLAPKSWIDLEGMEYIGTHEGSFYDGYKGMHHPTSYLSLKFLKREGNTFRVQLDLKFEEEVLLQPFSTKGICALHLEASIAFKAIRISEYFVEGSTGNFTNPEWLKSLVFQHISLDHLEGPFYPLPPPEAYSKNLRAVFETLVK
jgi:hypothetical protein